QGLSAQIQERLVLTIAQILEAGAETRGGNESFHPLLLKAFRSLGPTVPAVGPPGILLQRLFARKDQFCDPGSGVSQCSTWNTFADSARPALKERRARKHHCRG